MERALGRVSISQQAMMGIIARGTHKIEEATFLPKLPVGVHVRSVHEDPISMSQIFILESAEPVEGWTDYVTPGVEIPLSPVAMQLMGRVVDNTKDPEYLIRHMTIRELVNASTQIALDTERPQLDLTIEEFLREYSRTIQ
jgi:hypothetical protein